MPNVACRYLPKTPQMTLPTPCRAGRCGQGVVGTEPVTTSSYCAPGQRPDTGTAHARLGEMCGADGRPGDAQS